MNIQESIAYRLKYYEKELETSGEELEDSHDITVSELCILIDGIRYFSSECFYVYPSSLLTNKGWYRDIWSELDLKSRDDYLVQNYQLEDVILKKGTGNDYCLQFYLMTIIDHKNIDADEYI